MYTAAVVTWAQLICVPSTLHNSVWAVTESCSLVFEADVEFIAWRITTAFHPAAGIHHAYKPFLSRVLHDGSGIGYSKSFYSHWISVSAGSNERKQRIRSRSMRSSRLWRGITFLSRSATAIQPERVHNPCSSSEQFFLSFALPPHPLCSPFCFLLD